MEMRERSVSPEVADIVADIMRNKKIEYSINVSKDRISSNISRKEYVEIVDTALCKKQQGSSKIPVLSYNMARQMFKKGIMPTHYVILEKDTMRFMLEGGLDGSFMMED